MLLRLATASCGCWRPACTLAHRLLCSPSGVNGQGTENTAQTPAKWRPVCERIPPRIPLGGQDCRSAAFDSASRGLASALPLNGKGRRTHPFRLGQKYRKPFTLLILLHFSTRLLVPAYGTTKTLAATDFILPLRYMALCPRSRVHFLQGLVAADSATCDTTAQTAQALTCVCSVGQTHTHCRVRDICVSHLAHPQNLGPDDARNQGRIVRRKGQR